MRVEDDEEQSGQGLGRVVGDRVDRSDGAVVFGEAERAWGSGTWLLSKYLIA